VAVVKYFLDQDPNTYINSMEEKILDAHNNTSQSPKLSETLEFNGDRAKTNTSHLHDPISTTDVIVGLYKHVDVYHRFMTNSRPIVKDKVDLFTNFYKNRLNSFNIEINSDSYIYRANYFDLFTKFYKNKLSSSSYRTNYFSLADIYNEVPTILRDSSELEYNRMAE
jgi:hypothetical protein